MQYFGMPLGDYQTNCYLCWDEETKRCAIIDPGYEPETILAAIRARGLTPAMILLTHAHFDHVGAVRPLADLFGLSCWLCEKETALPESLSDGPVYYTDTYEDGDKIPLDSLRFTVLETPGHTPGSVCLRCGDLLFTGDTLFAGSCGRTDFPGGNGAAMHASLRRLAALPGDCTVLPGHGPATTLARERQFNPYMKG